MMQKFLWLSLFALPLAACQQAEAPDAPPSAAADSNIPGAAPPSAAASGVPASAAAPTASTTAASATPSFPAIFRGRWAIDAKDCTAQPGLTHIVIKPDGIDFYEAQARLISTTADDEGSVTAIVRHEGEGESSTLTYRLATDGTTLRFGRGVELFRYTRCG